jgi:hypothetical protein
LSGYERLVGDVAAHGLDQGVTAPAKDWRNLKPHIARAWLEIERWPRLLQSCDQFGPFFLDARCEFPDDLLLRWIVQWGSFDAHWSSSLA